MQTHARIRTYRWNRPTVSLCFASNSMKINLVAIKITIILYAMRCDVLWCGKNVRNSFFFPKKKKKTKLEWKKKWHEGAFQWKVLWIDRIVGVVWMEFAVNSMCWRSNEKKTVWPLHDDEMIPFRARVQSKLKTLEHKLSWYMINLWIKVVLFSSYHVQSVAYLLVLFFLLL